MLDPVYILLKLVLFQLVFNLSFRDSIQSSRHGSDMVTEDTKGMITSLIYDMLDTSTRWSLRGLLENKSTPVLCLDTYSQYLTMLASKQPVTSTDVEVFDRLASKNETFLEYLKKGSTDRMKRLKRLWNKDYCELLEEKLSECANKFERVYKNLYTD